MTPILIDNRGLIKLGLISVLSTVIVFVAGFLGGYQQAITFYTAGSEIETLVLPVQTVLLGSDVEPQLPDTIVAGAEIDVDQPQVKSKINTNTHTKTNVNTSAVESKRSVSSKKEKVKKNRKAPISNKLAAFEPASLEKLGESVATKEPDFVVVATLSSAELNNIKYSIQVGMYGRLINAENMVRLLRGQHIDAYVSDYINKKNESRYNVRFGYFVDKKSALSALKKYKSKQNSDGYLVKFSVKTMTRLADAKNVKQVIITEKIKKNSSPETMPLEAMPSEARSTETGQDKISQADVQNVLANTPEKNPIVQTRAVTEPY